MVTQVPGTGTEGVQLLGLDDVDVRVLLGADQHRGTAVRAETLDLDMRHGHAGLTAGTVILVRDLELGGEVLAPVGEQLTHPGFIGLGLGVPVVAQRQRAAAQAREAHHVLFHLVVAQGCTMVVVDVPVQLDRVFLDLGGAVRVGHAAHVKTQASHVLLHGADVGSGDVTLAERAIGEAHARGGALVLLVVGEEEQLVLDDRATQGHAVGGFLVKAVEVGLVTFQAVTDHVRVAVGVVHGTVELVGTRLGHGVDHRTGTTGNGGVVVGQVDVDFFDGVHRDRLTLGRQAIGFQAERIGGADAVDADGVEAGVLATGGDRAVSLADLRDARVQAHVVLDVAVGRRHGFDHVAVQVGASAHLVGTENFRTTGHGVGGDAFQGGHVAGQGGVDGVDLIQVQVDTLFGLGAFTRLGDGDGVRTTHAQAACVVAAGGVSAGAADGARFVMGNDDFSADNRLAGSGHDLAADTGRGALGKSRGSCQGSNQAKGQLGHPETWVVHCG